MKRSSSLSMVIACLALGGAAAAEDAAKVPVQSYGAPAAQSTLEVKLRAFRDVEVKAPLKAGQVVLYSWSTVGGVDISVDFHGDPDEAGLAEASYHKGDAAADHGSLIAPFAGMHGWQFTNKGADDVVVRITITSHDTELRKL